ncbi:MAG: ferritin family protein [Syntrophobacteraceae bacterium]|nr:ferritin family protein [Syntrophobacteraceae bacterium]
MSFCFNSGEVFQTAIVIEKNGLSFYERASQAVKDPEIAELFASLAKDEVAHKKRFEALLSALPEELKRTTVADPDQEIDLYIRALADQHIFGAGEKPIGAEAKLGTVEDVLKLAIQFEKDSVVFYLGMQEVTCEGKGKEAAELLVKEELRHVRRLTLQLGKCSSEVKACSLSWPEA